MKAKWNYDTRAAPYHIPLLISWTDRKGEPGSGVGLRYKYPNGQEGWDVAGIVYAWDHFPEAATVPTNHPKPTVVITKHGD